MQQSGGGFPTSHTTSTTTKVTPLIWFDKTYLQTTEGLLKAILVAVNLLGFICSQIGGCSTCGSVIYFNLISILAFWVTLILLALYLFHVVEKLHNVPWLLGEFVFCALWSVLYLLAALLIVLNGGFYAVAGFFGFVAMSLYGMDAYLKYKGYTSGGIAQGERTTQSNGADFP